MVVSFQVPEPLQAGCFTAIAIQFFSPLWRLRGAAVASYIYVFALPRVCPLNSFSTLTVMASNEKTAPEQVLATKESRSSSDSTSKSPHAKIDVPADAAAKSSALVAPPVSFFSLFRFSTRFEIFLDIIGVICAVAAGAAQVCALLA